MSSTTASEDDLGLEQEGMTRKNGCLVGERPQKEKEPSERASQDIVVSNLSRGPAYKFTDDERNIVPTWSDYELLEGVAVVLLSKESEDASLDELALLGTTLLRGKARSLQYVSRRTRKSKRLSGCGKRAKVAARILTGQHVKDVGCFPFISRE